MKKNDKDNDIIKYMIKLCNKIYSIRERLGNSYEDFVHDDIYQLSTCMVIIDLGESANNLTDNFKKENSHIPWNEVIGMRNVFAHNYMGIDFDEVWNTIENDIPSLEKELKKILSK